MAAARRTLAAPADRREVRSLLRRGSGTAAIVVALVAVYLNASGYATEPPAQPRTAAVAAQTRLLPSQLGDLDRAWSLTGDEAIQQVAGLHVGRFALTTAEVAGYGPDTTVWVARPSGATPADVLVQEMTNAIAKGGSPFGVPTPVPGRPGIWQTSGSGQQHFFFARDGAIWWLAADATAAPDALASLLTEVGR